MIEIIDRSDQVERLFDPYRDIIGRDFQAYRGHVYRVITYAMHFLGNTDIHRPMLETALVYHDFGLWTDKKLAYLGSSETLALRDNDWIDASGGMIRKGLSKAQVVKVESAIPDYGFADVLQRLAKNYGGNRLAGNLRVLRTVFKI